MVSASRLLAVAGVALVICAIPGPSVVFTISRGLTHGRRIALLSVAGDAFGLGVQMVAVAFGLGTALQQSTQLLGIVKLAGAVYLVFLGIRAIRQRRSLAQAVADRVSALTPFEATRDGAIVGVTNPKAIAVMVAVLPQFAVPATGHLPEQMLVLGLPLPLIAFCVGSIWAFAAGSASQWLSRSPERLAAVGGVGGLSMIGVGISLAVAGRKE